MRKNEAKSNPTHPIFSATVSVLDSRLGTVYLYVPLPIDFSEVQKIAKEQGYLLADDWLGLDVLSSDIPIDLINKHWDGHVEELVSWLDYEALARKIYRSEYGNTKY